MVSWYGVGAAAPSADAGTSATAVEKGGTGVSRGGAAKVVGGADGSTKDTKGADVANEAGVEGNAPLNPAAPRCSGREVLYDAIWVLAVVASSLARDDGRSDGGSEGAVVAGR